MKRFLVFKKSNRDIGFLARTKGEGPEATLLDDFVDKYASTLRRERKSYALFYEPLLPTGYPDLVVVKYNPRVYEKWTLNRITLGVLDLKVLHHLHFVGFATSSMIEKQLGLNSKVLLRSLEQLLDAKLVKREKESWVPKSLRSTYGISNIRAIEAKMSNWATVLRQANLNQWFATESYVLLPAVNRKNDAIVKARESGIGVFSLSSELNVQTIQKPLIRARSPVSYASWLFNEWVGRRLFLERGA